MGMVDTTEKPVIRRQAETAGKLFIAPNTIHEVLKGRVKKGDPLIVAEVAAMNASKQTHLLIPHCHQIALDMVKVTFKISDEYIEARCFVKGQARTGVEMEALVGVSTALMTLWDMVKYLEKDEKGQYPQTRISDIRVVKKEKGTLTVSF